MRNDLSIYDAVADHRWSDDIRWVRTPEADPAPVSVAPDHPVPAQVFGPKETGIGDRSQRQL